MLDRESGQFGSEQIGSFFSFAKVREEFGPSLIGEARIPKRDGRICETLLAMYRAGKLSFSFEILVSEMTESEGVMVIDAAEGNELIGMAVVSTPAYPEATALKLVAENENREDDRTMDENQKKIAELEAKLLLAEQKSENDEELRKKEDELTEEREKREQAEAELSAAGEKLTEREAQIAEREKRIAELEAQVSELAPFKAEAETLKAEKAAAELAARQQELTAFAQAQGLDVQEAAIAEAIQKADYAALVAAAVKAGANKPESKPAVAAYAMAGGMPIKGNEYDDLLGKA